MLFSVMVSELIQINSCWGGLVGLQLINNEMEGVFHGHIVLIQQTKFSHKL
jgi:hypothetical protein